MKRLVLIAMVVLMSSSIALAQEPCTADFNCDQNVDATDVDTFLLQFGRNPFNDPCPDCYDSPCACTFPCDPPAPLSQTGQTTSYATGDDGDLERGVTSGTPRFTDNSDGTITDNQPDLIWLKDANCFGQRTWSQALSDCNGLTDGSCGLTDGSSAGDWRLTNRFELENLLNLEYYNPALPNTQGNGKWTQGAPFNNVQSDDYWSSTTYANSSNHAWFVYMLNGGLSYNSKDEFNYVWCVRGGH